jgi:hypothetical protein
MTDVCCHNVTADEAVDTFTRLYYGELPPKVFEQWLYGARNLEALIGEDDYISLMGFVYDWTSNIAEAKELGAAAVGRLSGAPPARHRLIVTLRAMLDGSLPLLDGCNRLWHLDYRGYDPGVSFCAYADEIAEWGEDACRESLLKICRQLLDQLTEKLAN